MRTLVALALLAVLGCGSSAPPPVADRGERSLRRSLGIPDGAERVLVVSPSSHLDLNFLDTFDGYYEGRVRSILASALGILDADGRQRFGVAEIGFLRRYHDEHPADRERMRAHALAGRLRIVGGGLSSPDTVLTLGESLLRDWSMGIDWSRRELGVRPTSAWQPDSFGHSPTLPTILEHLGFDAVGFFRVDGGQSLAAPGNFEIPAPPGSTAERLIVDGAADFLWRAPDGAEVLARWLPFGYGQGDDIDLASPLAVSLGPLLGIDVNRAPFVDPAVVPERLAAHIEALEPLRRTPYQLLPVGIDFSWPKPELLAYLDRWNDERYPETGVWAVVASFDEYAALVRAHADRLPALERDVNPYWTGFYTHKPHLKGRMRVADERLLAAEKIAAVASLAGATPPADALRRGWDRSAFMNHHDAITGTATDEVIRVDLEPWSAEALEQGRVALEASMDAYAARVDTSASGASRALVVFNPSGHPRAGVLEVTLELAAADEASRLVARGGDGRRLPLQLGAVETTPGGARAELLVATPAVPALGHTTIALASDGATPGPVPSRPATLRREGERLVLSNGVLRARLDPRRGGCLDALARVDGPELLDGPSNDLVRYRDLGGAYRIGAELGDDFVELDRLCERAARVEVLEEGPLRVALRITSAEPVSSVRHVRLATGAAALELEVTTAAERDTSVAVRFETRLDGDRVTTSVPFGEVERSRVSFWEPTYWPVTAWLAIADGDPGGSLLLSVEGTRGAGATPRGRLELMVARNAFWDFLGPTGLDPEPRTTRYVLALPDDGAPLPRAGVEPVRPLRTVRTAVHPGPWPAERSWIRIDDAATELSALKPADDGSGDLVLRLVRHGPVPAEVAVELSLPGVAELWRADGLEERRELLAELPAPGPLTLPMHRSVETFRLIR